MSNDFTHKINADRILTMGKGARKAWRVLQLPESIEAQRATIRGALRMRAFSPRRRHYKKIERGRKAAQDIMALIPPGDPWFYADPVALSDEN